MKTETQDPQSFSVKRAQVEFHNFASLGEPERAIAGYLGENVPPRGHHQGHREFIGPMSPFLEIGANAGHTSYMLANEFGGEGFALDISADALRHGIALMDRWGLARAPVRVAGDAVQSAVPRRLHALRHGLPDAQPVHEHRERVPRSEARARARRRLSLRRGTAAPPALPAPLPLPLLRTA